MLQLTVAILISAIMAILGLINIFFKDLAWEWTEWSNRNRGVVSERTSAWEAASTLSGIMLVVLGVALLVLSLSVWGR